MGWRDKLDAAIQKNKEKIVEIVTVENAKKAMSAIAVAAATAAVEKVREEIGKQRERREQFESESDDVLHRIAKSAEGESDASTRMAADVLEKRLRRLESKSIEELRIISASFSHSDAERERASALLRRR
ncbi:hypothetical protein [Pseudomonas syringae]|uniref:Uncharacterized protein n=1 Tax=Pseudomonas syringae TaxID=317 RepID=A0A085UMU0_PSESX|nr:hypothetical protein [Pseudomonas syringae]KFE44503.1 hypothetical protein IV02_29110 [Pseudomonas syringae]